MGQALYRKYRSKSLADIKGQEHITKTLSQAIDSGRISHAYLFTGPRGVGKTSVARILAHAINNLDYSDDKQYVDIIEIDGASNGRVEEIRELRDKVYVAPTETKYKVYIIDEVHMISTSAFNALLKTLEEPPEHVVFILATTEAHKLPATIVSRTQRFQFKPIDSAVAVKHLKDIARQEKISIDQEALELIAEHGQGSFRDSISLLDQAANYSNPITAEAINSLLGNPPATQLDELINNLSISDRQAVANGLSKMYEQGYPAAMIAARLASRLRAYLIADSTIIPSQQLLSILSDLIAVPASEDPASYLLITLLKTMPDQPLINNGASTRPVENNSEQVVTKPEPKPESNPKPEPPTSEPATLVTKDKAKPAQKKEAKPAQSPPSGVSIDEPTWHQVLDTLKVKHNTLYGIARMAKLDNRNPGIIRLQFAYQFHKQRINDSKNREIILKAVEQITKTNYSLECVVDKDLLTERSAPKPSQKAPDISTISNIFGGGEMLSQ